MKRQIFQMLLGQMLFGLLTMAAVCAQEVTLQSSIDRSTVRENESFTYLLRLQGRTGGEPDLTPLASEFEILQQSRNTSIQMAGGRTDQIVEWRLQLMPRSAGTFTLPPLELDGNFSNPVEIEVLPALAGDTPGEIFMEVEVTPEIAYTQSEVIYTLRLFRGVSTGRSSLSTPEVTGGETIVVPLGDDREYQTTRDERNFIVLERRYSIFPQAPGELSIQPMTFEAVVITTSGFSSLQRYRSEPISVTVQPPVAPPAAFATAAWLPARNLEISDRWSGGTGELTVGIPQTRTLTVRADGVLETQLPELIVGQSEGIRQYSDQPELASADTPAGLQATRTERFAVIAQSAGAVTIPGLELPWFNVQTGIWDVATVPSTDVVVLPSLEQSAPPPEQEVVDETTAARGASNDVLVWQGISAGLLTGWILTIALLLRRRGAGGFVPSTAEAPPRRANHRRVLRDLRAACGQNDAELTRALLLEWGGLRLPEAPRTLAKLAEVLPGDLSGAVTDLERSLYGPGAERWSGEALKQALSQLDAVTQRPGSADKPELLPLYR